VYGGWDSTKKTGMQFYDQEFVDFRGDITLRVAVWMGSAFALDHTETDPNYQYIAEFPLDFTTEFDDGLLKASVSKGRLSVSMLLRPELPWIVTSNGKPAVNWGPQFIGQYRATAYQLRHMVVVNLPSKKRGDYKEWDLLPFLPGGLVERNRRKH
jgi:hypothetical protein